MRCSHCQQENAPGAKFCSECGRKLEAHCPKCGAVVASAAKFCGECGSPVSAQSAAPPARVPTVPREERRWATLLFADLSDFTGMSDQLDPEDVKTLASQCTKRLCEEVRRFGGTVLTIAGDQVVAAFGAPVAHEDDAERAVRAALAMRDGPLQDRAGRPIKIHIGVNTGEVMAGFVGLEDQPEFAVMGDTTNVAARLMSAAPPGSVLVGEETWRSTRDRIRYRDLPAVSAKGKQRPVPVWEALEALTEPKARPLGTAPLVGRDEELSVLTGIWLRVMREARPHLITVLGDPGLGKTRLVAEFEKRFCAGARVLHGRCLPYGEALGYGALITALKESAGLTAEADKASAHALWEEAARAVLCKESEADRAEIIRHLALLSGLRPAAGSADPPADQRALHGSVRRYFEALARAQPLCWIIEDIHWADDALLDLIEFVAGRTKEAPVLVLTQARPGLLEKRPSWGAGLRGFTTLSLGPLSTGAGHELIAALCRERSLTSEVAAGIDRVAGGNPLFAEELVAMIAERGNDAGLPSAIKTLIAARLDALPPGERRTLQLASVFGKTFWLGGLRALGAGSTASDDLERLEQKDLLRVQVHSQFRSEKEFAFKHDLIRDVAYDMLPRSERQPLHGRIADWIEHTAADTLDAYLDQLAHHTVSAGQEERALGFLSEAAERAARVAAHRQEAALLAQAIAIAERLGRADAVGELRARRGTAFERVGMWLQARPELEEALKQMTAASEARRAEVQLTLAVICYWLLDLAGVREHVAGVPVLAEKAARPDLLAETGGWRAILQAADGDLPSAMDLFAEALPRAGNRLAPFTVYPQTCYWLGQTAEAIDIARNLMKRLRGLNDTASTMFAFPHLGLALAANGRYAEAVRTFEEARHFAQEHQTWPHLARVLSMAAGFRQDIFDYEGNEALNQEADDLAQTHNFPPTSVSARIDLLLNYARRGDVGRTEGLLEQTQATVSRNVGWHRWLWDIRLAELRAELALDRGEFDQAIRSAAETLAQSRGKGRIKYEALALWTRGRALCRLEKRDDALADLRAALLLARRIGDPALLLRVATTLLEIDGDDGLLEEARTTARRIWTDLPNNLLRRAFQTAEPIARWKLITPEELPDSPRLDDSSL